MVESEVPAVRIRDLNAAPIRADGDHVLYWMIAARRAHRNYALDRAAERARELGKPLVVLEPLRCGYRWASDRFHRFVIEGMRDNARSFEGTGAHYYPYVEPEAGAGKGLVEALGGRASLVVTDEYPCFFLPRMTAAAAARLPVRVEAVDSNGLLPLHATERAFERAVDFRRFLQRELPKHWGSPRRKLRAGLPPPPPLPEERRWPRADLERLARPDGLARLPIDHGVGPVSYAGGALEGARTLKTFLEILPGYHEARRDLEEPGTSGLSPYLHFGHVSAHQVFEAVAAAEGWDAAKVSKTAAGKKEGWWGMSPAAEAFLDQLVTWRELGFQFCKRRMDYDRYDSLPLWARESLGEHRNDRREFTYTPAQFENVETHDELWNAAQNQLRGEGRIHNYLRMLWGKKILHWSRTPEEALAVMIELNNKYAVDGRDPNSYSGIFWTLGRFDRPWAPKREIFGCIRYMSSESTRKKLRVDGYVRQWVRG